MNAKILLVEDDETLLETLAYNLRRQAYSIVTTSSGREAVSLARREKPDLIVLDIMLPGIDGFEVCRIVRKEQSVPILMLTARADEMDKLNGLEVGADDYLTKPFSMRELQARVSALLRRVKLIRDELSAEQSVTPAAEKSALMQFGNLEINSGKREVRLDDTPLNLKPKEYELLQFLALHQGIALSRSLILEKVWGWTFDGNSRTVDVHVRWLREKIEPDPANSGRIVTIRRIGYRFDG